jgi:hypothetical protein
VETIQAHLDALGPDEGKLYRALGLAALAIARQANLSDAAAKRVEAALKDQS